MALVCLYMQGKKVGNPFVGLLPAFQFLPVSTGELQRSECLKSLRDVAIPLAERPARGDLTGEVCHWADGYHLNVRLYEKLLLSVFDILDEGKLTQVSTLSINLKAARLT